MSVEADGGDRILVAVSLLCVVCNQYCGNDLIGNGVSLRMRIPCKSDNQRMAIFPSNTTPKISQILHAAFIGYSQSV